MPGEMKERISNFFYYHKGKIFAIAAACVLLVYGIMTDAGSGPEIYLYGVTVNVSVPEENIESVCEEGAEVLGLDTQHQEIFLETGMEIDAENPQNNALSGNLEKMTASVFSHELDFMVCTAEVMEYYAEPGGLEELSGLEELEGLAETDGQGTCYGVSLAGTLLEGEDKDAVFCIFKNSAHKAETLELVRALVSENGDCFV